MVEQDAQVKLLLNDWQKGDNSARDSLFSILYKELRLISSALLRTERNTSLSTGDLVNEVVLKLVQLENIKWADKAHFIALSSKVMRQILVDNYRQKNADKRFHHKVTLVTGVQGNDICPIDLDSLEQALFRLSVIDETKADIVELRYFGGMSLRDIGHVLGKSESTVKRDWRVARAWLLDALTKADISEQ
jgi:RNA polymerase sigma factor (TIGR02999 family)